MTENLNTETEEAVRIVRKLARLYENATRNAARFQRERDDAREEAVRAERDEKREKAIERLITSAEAFLMAWENEEGDAAMSRAADALFIAIEGVKETRAKAMPKRAGH